MIALLAMLACTGSPDPYEWPAVEPGPPVAGAAEGTLRLPMGTPMGGYSARCSCLSGISRPDKRDTAYQRSFVETAGIQTRPRIGALWLENGDDHLVMIKVDLIYSYDNLVVELTRALEAATGEELDGRVTVSTNHSHASYGPFSDQVHFYLGGDYYNEEIFRRLVDQLADVALDAYEAREPAAIGTGWAEDWDPENRVYRDRRGENNDLVPEGWEEDHGRAGKDPYLNVLRVDSAGGDPLALVYTFGIHGIAMPDSCPMLSSEAPGHVELTVREAFDEPVVVMHLQGAVGDASPAGSDRRFARLETVGEYAVDEIVDLWERTPTSAGPIRMETASRHIWQHHSQIAVSRDGAVDWRYTPLDEHANADNVIYEEDGRIAAPIDEFNAPYGAVFCGSGDFEIPVGGIDVEVPPYNACMDVELISRLLLAFFDLEEEELHLPLTESYKAGTTVSRLGPLSTLTPTGDEVERDLLVGFFPAELTAMWTEQWRRRVEAELGYEMPLAVGVSQDHEGYFLIAEDWLSGGYEPSIAVWGPLQGEHVMEGVLHTAEVILGTDVHEDPDPWGYYAPTEYRQVDLPTEQPDTTPEAGTLITEAPEYLWLPDGFVLDLDIPEEVPRVQGLVQLAWKGGDPAADSPRVVLERLEGEAWEEVETRSGRPITEALPDVLLAYTPDPLYPSWEEQTHTWWATWQAVGHVHDRAGLPLGTYRLHVYGHRYVGGDAHWPWTSEPYEVVSDSFELVGAELDLEVAEGGLWASIPAPPDGYRLVDLDGSSVGDNPTRGSLTLAWTGDDGPTEVVVEPDHVASGRTWYPATLPTDADSLAATDGFGNHGMVDLGEAR